MNKFTYLVAVVFLLMPPGVQAQLSSAEPVVERATPIAETLRQKLEDARNAVPSPAASMDAVRRALKETEVTRDSVTNLRQRTEEMRDAVNVRREAFQSAVQDHRDALKQNLEERREQLKAQFEERREEARRVLEERKEELRREMESRREEARERIEAHRADLKTKLESIKDERKKAAVERIDENLKKLNERLISHFSDSVNQIAEVLVRIESRADKAEANSKDATAVRTLITTAETVIAAAREAIVMQSGKIYGVTVEGEETLRKDTGEARTLLHEDLVSLRAKVKAAHDAVRQAAVALAQIPGVDTLPEPATSTPISSNP